MNHGIVHTSFRLHSLEISCTDSLRLAQATEVSELLRLAAEYYCYRDVVLICRPQRISSAAISLLSHAIVDAEKRGVRIEVRASQRLKAKLEGRPQSQSPLRQIGFSVVSPTKNSRRTRR